MDYAFAGVVSSAAAPSESPVLRFAFEATPDPAKYVVHVPVDLAYFRGHFEELPILPAVVQLAKIVSPLARLVWPDLGEVTGARRLRFKRPIGPGAKLEVEVQRSEQRVDFVIVDGPVTAASGSLHFATAASD